ncbi:MULTISPECIES: hypothetical protein [unclassified Pseudodesulfovibrio]|uniref:hypothetical protein n=1 Tax=unclassified Pseudodesulfovibrio TaxID=2661612 RepID=UPI000FEB88E2|nr:MULTISPECIES: hypothetical protein [unclassified Pseudodesulfovibrio]MCJ2164684.1 hypothetical protein [Pseudodesulfovibrio sp. S3-i]RWU04124.1 hypothetical protein DWB63_08955 [Pseudodesulfovibrio sp. S3]
MSETANIAIMAEDISSHIFKQFKWTTKGPMNVDWKCVCPQKHSKKTHPSDVVFHYIEPYRNSISCINTDLKSYKKGSITRDQICGAIQSLDMAIECAKVSGEWQTLYAPPENYEVFGLLFIYNHDGGYDLEFGQLLDKAMRRVNIAPKNKIFVLSPYDICYLKTVTNDIATLRGAEDCTKIPDSQNCSFYYPTTSRLKHAHAPVSHPATLEMLTGPWQIMRYNIDGDASKGFGISVYMRTPGNTKEEFIYLIDYLCTYQLLNESKKIMINLPNASPIANVMFENAVKDYISMRNDDFFAQKIKSISLRRITNIVTSYSTVEIGMRYE